MANERPTKETRERLVEHMRRSGIPENVARREADNSLRRVETAVERGTNQRAPKE